MLPQQFVSTVAWIETSSIFTHQIWVLLHLSKVSFSFLDISCHWISDSTSYSRRLPCHGPPELWRPGRPGNLGIWVVCGVRSLYELFTV